MCSVLKRKPTFTSGRMEQGGGGGFLSPLLALGPKFLLISIFLLGSIPVAIFLSMKPSCLSWTVQQPPNQLSHASHRSLGVIVCTATSEFFSALHYDYVSLLLKYPPSLQIPDSHPDRPTAPRNLGVTSFSHPFSTHSPPFSFSPPPPGFSTCSVPSFPGAFAWISLSLELSGSSHQPSLPLTPTHQSDLRSPRPQITHPFLMDALPISTLGQASPTLVLIQFLLCSTRLNCYYFIVCLVI